MKVRYNQYGSWLQQRFGARVYKVSVDGGFTCPNRDGMVAWGGCTYCNNDSFRPHGVERLDAVETQINRGIKFLASRFAARKFLVYWQNYSNTYAPVEQLRELYRRALESDSRIVGMTIGTRPDCVEDGKLEMIQEVAGKRYVCMEYGLESIYDGTLRRINRGHDLACYLDAVRRTRSYGMPVCSHIIMGLPGETREQMLRYPDVINELKIDFLKIHHLHVVRNTQLAREYQRCPFPTFEYPEWIALVCDLLERLDPDIVIQRLYGWAQADHLIAPRWNRSKAELIQDIEKELEARGSFQGIRLAVAR